MSCGIVDDIEDILKNDNRIKTDLFGKKKKISSS